VFNTTPPEPPTPTAFPTPLPFVKIQGAGNDFVVLDSLSHPLAPETDFATLAIALCDRHFGVGGDGLLLLDRAQEGQADVRMRMWNPDGSEDMCGNGLRCIVRLAHERGHAEWEFEVQTLAGTRRARVEDSRDICVEMGEPQWDAASIPLDTSLIQGQPQEFFLELGGERVGPLCSVSTGSTHTVLWTDEKTVARWFEEWSPVLETHPAFPERSSILWAQVLAPTESRVRIWERGVGETLACGTGACAVAVAAMRTGRTNQRVMKVQSRGGTLAISWYEGEPIWKSGPAQVVFSGVWPG
jgi:diaminopimelate epimerase